MKANRENEIVKEIRRRAFARSDGVHQEHDIAQAVDYTLVALEEVTGLARIELETIASEVQYAVEPYDRDFFSIKNQITLGGGSLGLIIILFGLLIAWII